MKRNLVCSILFKDKNGVYRNIFDIEGDKPNDPSLYVVQMNHCNPESNKTREEQRTFCLQASYHSEKDDSGLVQTHTKRKNHRFGHKKQVPLSERNYPLYHYHFNNDNLEKYPSKESVADDILINIKPSYFSDYSFIFYTDNESLKEYLLKHDLFLIHSYKLPLVNIDNINFAVLLNINKLKEIQSKKNNILTICQRKILKK